MATVVSTVVGARGGGNGGGGLGDLVKLKARFNLGTRPANSLKLCCAVSGRCGDLALSLSRGNDIRILSPRRCCSSCDDDVCTKSSSIVGLIGVVERGLSIGVVLLKIYEQSI